MFERTAIEAVALNDARALVAAGSRFGFEFGRLVAALPPRWLEIVYAQIELLPDGIEKQRARIALTRLSKRALVPVAIAYDMECSWKVNALLARRQKAVEDIVVGASGDPEGLPDFWDYLSSLSMTNSVLIEHTVLGFESVARRLLEQTPRMVLVDPYFDICLTRHNTLFKAIVGWGQGGKCTHYDIYCRADEVLGGKFTLAKFERAAINVFEECKGPGPCQFRLFLLDDRSSSGSPMHRRLLIGEYGGVAIDYGFRLEEGRTSDVVALSGEALEKFRIDYYDGKHGFACRHVVCHST